MDNRLKVIGVVVLALVAVALLAYSAKSSFTQPVAEFDAKPLETPDTLFVREMVAKCNGDPSVLTAQERARMDQITKGFTEVVIKARK